uniref:Uncharacterized protein n=1 Tax=viral metagenome TaxID=1070528 RepID=A0A6H2A3N6_9ZZZZ
MNNTESVVYIARKLHWTRAEIGQLSPSQFNEILKELYYQESIDEWRKMHTVATLLAAIYNTIPRKNKGALKAGDFLSGGIPQREVKKVDSLEKLAADRDIRLPSKELRNR